MTTRFFALSALLAVAACSGPGVPVKVSQALQGLSADLQGAGALAVAGSSTWSPAQEAAFAAVVRRDQCAAETADPVVPVINAAIDVKLTGSISSSGSFSVTGSTLGVISPSVTFGRSNASEQELDIPVRFVALSGVANELLTERSAVLANLPMPIKLELAGAAVRDSQAAGSRLDRLVQGFDPSSCGSAKGRPAATPLLMSRRPAR